MAVGNGGLVYVDLRKKIADVYKRQASTATISRINKCLVYGADGYQRVLERLDSQKKK